MVTIKLILVKYVEDRGVKRVIRDRKVPPEETMFGADKNDLSKWVEERFTGCRRRFC